MKYSEKVVRGSDGPLAVPPGGLANTVVPHLIHNGVRIPLVQFWEEGTEFNKADVQAVQFRFNVANNHQGALLISDVLVVKE